MDWLLAPLVPFADLPWLGMCPLEIVATLFGLWSVVCYVRESVWSWPTGLLNVALSIVLYWNGQLYAESALQVIYVVLQCYGWWLWVRGGDQHTGVVITRTSPRLWLMLAAIAVVATVAIGLGLARWTNSTTPWWDTTPVVLSLIAQWMISKKKLENWLVWMAVDVISIPLFAYKELYLVSVLSVVFLVLCVLGLRSWLATWRATQATIPAQRAESAVVS